MGSSPNQVSTMAFTVRKLFLVDGLGATATALLLFFLVSRLDRLFGMPAKAVQMLASLAIVFAIYSLGCYFLLQLNNNRRIFLRIIAIANIFYCILTIFLMMYYSRQLTWLGFAYFICEIAIIALLVFFELRTAIKKD